MLGFVTAVPVVSASPSLRSTFVCERPAASTTNVTGPTMGLRPALRSNTAVGGIIGGAASIMAGADDYMARTIVMQYKATACASGVYGVQCTESTGKLGRSADAARVAAGNLKFRMSQRSAAKFYGDMYENRKQALKGTICHTEESKFQTYGKSTAAFVLAKAESTGACDKYGIPESVEEAAMMRYMHIQQQSKACPAGVIPSSCVEGASKGAADDARVAQLASKYRNAQKATGQLLQEKYNQVKHGISFSNGCHYEESICAEYPAVASAFRASTYGY